MINEPIQPPFPGQITTIEPRDGWTALERWVWREIGSGRPADINAYLEAKADPECPDEWTLVRRISAAFLQSIAFHEPYRSALPRSGMLIIGAWFDQPIDFRDGHLLRSR